MIRFVNADRRTGYLLPPSVDERLPEGHLARFIVEVVDGPDLGAFVNAYGGRGSDAHHLPWSERFAPDAPEPEQADPLAHMLWRLKTKAGRAAYAKRKRTVEPVFGIIKHVLGFRQFSLRGIAGVRGEWRMVALAWNLKRLHALQAA
jgi:hypothetical protein